MNNRRDFLKGAAVIGAVTLGSSTSAAKEKASVRIVKKELTESIDKSELRAQFEYTGANGKTLVLDGILTETHGETGHTRTFTSGGRTITLAENHPKSVFAVKTVHSDQEIVEGALMHKGLL